MARPDKHKPDAASHSKRPAFGAAIAALLGGWLLPQPKWSFGASADGFDWAHASSRPCTMTQPIKLSEAEMKDLNSQTVPPPADGPADDCAQP